MLVHVPEELHFWMYVLPHCMAPGVHTPPHAPEVVFPKQTWGQAIGDPHAPVELHVSCTVLLLQLVVPGVHTPPHEIPTQT